MNFQVSYKLDPRQQYSICKFFDTMREAQRYAAEIEENEGAEILSIVDTRQIIFYH